MKNLLPYAAGLLIAFTSCTGTKMATSSYSDDVYANPVADRQEQARIAAAQKKAQEAYQKRYNDSVAAVQQQQNNNPYYQDPQYNSDDYYDYSYASRYKRFQDPVNGVGYYDNYYTNTYFYSGNPYQYGMSVYNGYSFWPSYSSYNYMPSTYFYSSMGWGSPGFSSGFGFGYGGYGGYGNPYGYGYYDPFYNNAYWAGYYNGYNHGYGNGYWGYPFGYGFGYGGYPYGPYGYSPYGYGGYCNPYGWGYYNAYDQNSGYTYAPRTSHGGGSGNRVSNPGMNSNDSYYQNFVNKVVEQQSKAVKFTDVPVARTFKRDNSYQQNGNVSAPVYNNPDFYNNTTPVRTQPANQNQNQENGFKSNVPANQNNDGLYNNNGNVIRHNQGDNINNNNNNHVPVYTQPNNGNGRIQQPVYDTPRQTPNRSNENTEYHQQQQPRIFESSPSYNSSPSSFPRGGGSGSPGGGGGGRPR